MDGVSPTLYPHLFRELHWSDERPLSDLPEYVKFKNEPKVYRVTWEDYLGNHPFCDGEDKTDFAVGWSFHKQNSLPATEEEYKNQKPGTR